MMSCSNGEGTIEKRTVEERMRFILDDTTSFFNSNNRCYSRYSGSCLYYDRTTGYQCAIGRYFPGDEKFDVLREEDCNVQDLIRNYKYLWNEIKIFRGISKSFLTSLQNLHDCADFWNKDGLSDEGVEKVRRMKLMYLGEGGVEVCEVI